MDDNEDVLVFCFRADCPDAGRSQIEEVGRIYRGRLTPPSVSAHGERKAIDAFRGPHRFESSFRGRV